MKSARERFLNALEHSIIQNQFISMNLGHYQGDEIDLKKLLIKKVIIRKKDKLSLVYRYRTKDITKNYSIAEATELINTLLGKNAFRFSRLQLIERDLEVQLDKGDNWKIKEFNNTTKELPNTDHDKNKNRKIKASGKQYLQALKITDLQGNVRPHGQDKFRQINHYIEILSSLLKAIPKKESLHIVDMGSGKGYLTFALYDYLTNELKRPADIMGVEFRKDLVDFCNDLAKKSNFDQLEFIEGTIGSYQAKQAIDVLIALHACDTATDDAIFKGMQANAELIIVAPCCHKQIRKEMQKDQTHNTTSFLTKHGIFMERQAEMVTDGLRALLLEQAGYATKIFEFIATEHTPKNVLIVAQKRKKKLSNQEFIHSEIKASKKYFGIKDHYLETLIASTER